MKQVIGCPEKRELSKLVATTHPSERDQYILHEILWGMLAEAMRYADGMRDSKPPEGKKFRSLLKPFLGDLLDMDFAPKDLKILDKFLFGKKRELPYGTIAVDTNGIVTLITVTPPPTNPDPVHELAEVTYPDEDTNHDR